MLEDNLRLLQDAQAGGAVLDGDQRRLQGRQDNALLQHLEVDLVCRAVLQEDLLAGGIVDLHRRLCGAAQLALHQGKLLRVRPLRNQVQVVPELAHDVVEEHGCAPVLGREQRAEDELVRRRLLRREHELGLAQQPLAVEGDLEDHDVVQGVDELDVDGHGLADDAGERELLLRLRRQRHQLHRVPREVARGDVAEHDAARDVPGLQRLERELVLALAAAVHLDGRGAGDVDEVALHLEGGGLGRVVLHDELVRLLLAGRALDHHVLVGERLLRDAVEHVLVGLVRAGVVQHQLGLDVADPLGLEGEGVVRHGGLAIRLLLLGHEVLRPLELVAALREGRLDGPLALRGVDDGDLLGDVLPGLRVELQGAVGVGRGARALDLVDADVHVGGQGDGAGVHARLLGAELQAELRDVRRQRPRAGRARLLPRVGRRAALGGVLVAAPAHALGPGWPSAAAHGVDDRDLLRAREEGGRHLHVVDDGVGQRLFGAGVPVLEPHACAVHLHVAVRQDELLRS
mmetsp:Transcript_51348/g.135682  ORF Transcript_51348/g.135682 Transcript_51348/m.135682 type:complete len:516 (+) Transcript_51348:327-1874(+)